MEELGLMRDLAVVFAVALGVNIVLQRIRVPPIAGFVIAGVLVGPSGLALVRQDEAVRALAGIGVVLLLYAIGLELSLSRLRRLWRPILVGGALQLVVTAAIGAGVGRLLGLAWPTAALVGYLLAISSTAIVLRVLERRGEIDAPHGRLTLGVLVFQDFSVVPALLMLPALAGADSGVAGVDVLWSIAKAAAILAGVFAAARLLVPRLLALVAATRRRDLFVLAVVMLCIGTAWVAAAAGVSLAIGAFLGGLVVAGSDYRDQALAEMMPLKEVLISLFFVSIGMLLDLGQLLAEIGPVLSLLVAVLLGKFVIVLLIGAALRLPLRVAVLTAAALAQVGEFAFVIMQASGAETLLPPPLANQISAVAILSLVIAPVVLSAGPHLASGVAQLRWLANVLGVRSVAEVDDETREWRDHVIIAGYGLTGEALARALAAAGIPYLIVDINPENVRTASARGERILYGDVTNPDVLRHLHVETAREVVVVINDPLAAERAVAAVKSASPNAHVVVRARYLGDVAPLLARGASEVVAAEVEAAVEVVERVLGRHQVAAGVVAATVAALHRQNERPAPAVRDGSGS